MPAPSQPNLVPAAARRQVAEADRLIAELNAPPVAPSAAPQPAPQPQVVPQPQPAPPPNPQLQQPPAPPPTFEELYNAERQRYSALQGKYNTETRLLREQNEQNATLVSQLLERAPTPAAPASPAPPTLTPEERMRALGATAKDIEEYGELLPLVARMAENMLKPTLAKLDAELRTIQQSQGTLSQEAIHARKDMFFTTLDRDVTNWRLINEAPHFLDWLNLIEVFSGVSRRKSLTDAYNRLDAARVAAIFQAYVREYPDQSRAPGAPPVDPATLLAPEIRGDAVRAPGGSGGKRIWSESEISDFYTRVRKKLVSKADYDSMQAEIALATSEGRIKPNRIDHHANSR